MSDKLSIAAASILALSAVALPSPGSARAAELAARMGAAMDLAAPRVSLAVPDCLPAPPLSLISSA